MWPFTPKMLYDRYSKLIKLIMSIDSHFEVTENKENSVRLHLPNYKGNQPMDFHIYLMEPFLFISFITEVEGEKISVQNHYHQDTNQQDMFNMAMSSNLKKVHEVLGRKYEDDSKKEDTCDRLTENQEDISLSKATKENVDEDIEDNDNDEEDEEETVEQRQALYFFVHKLTTPSYYQGDSLTSSLTLLTYKNTLELSDYEVDEILSTPFYKEDELIKDLKSIKDSLTIYHFLYECVTLIDKTESGAAIPYFFSLIQELGLSIEEVRNGINLIETVPSEHFYDRIRKFSWEDLNDNEQADETKESSNKAKETQENGIPIEFLVEDLKENFDYNASFKRHALTFMILRPNSEFWYYSRSDDEKPLWIYNDKKDDKDRGVYMMDESYAIGLYPLLWYYKKYDDKESLCWLFDFLDRQNIDLWAQDYLEEAVDDSHPEELIKKMKRYVPSLKIGNDPQKIKENLSWSWIDIQSLLLFINYCMNSLDGAAKPDENINSLQDCSSLSDLAYFILKDLGVGPKSSSMKEDAEIDSDENNDVSVQEEDEEPIIVESWPLLDFARQHGTMKVTAPMTHVNRRTGEEFEARSCAFVHPTKKDEQGRAFVLFVSFSSSLGELSSQEIAAQQNELVVVKYKSGEYALDRKQDNTTVEVEISTDTMEDFSQISNLTPKTDNNEMKLCKYCGERIEANSKFCNYCGKQQNQEVFVLKDFPNVIISALPVNSQEDLDEIIRIGNESLVSGDYEKAYFYLREAARFGDAQSAFNTGLLLFNGDGVEKDEDRAITFFMQAAEKGFVQAYNSIGVCFSQGKGVPKDMSKAVSWYQKGADKGDKLAQNSLGRCYLVGDGVEKNLELGIYWTKKSAEQGYNGSLFNMGFCYETGLGVDKDLSKAIHYYKEALEKGYHQAEQRLKAIQNE